MMSKLPRRPSLALLGTLLAMLSGDHRSLAMTDDTTQALQSRVEQAFTAARAGDFGPASELAQSGPAIVPLIEPYLTDADEAIRRQAISLLGLAGDPAAIPLLARALDDPLADLRERAALALYDGFPPAELAAHSTLGEQLRDSVAGGLDAASAVLLLGYFPDDRTRQVLARVATERAEHRTELHSDSPVVTLGLVVEVALSRLGVEASRNALRQRFHAGGLDTLMFLLEILREIDATDLLRELAAVTLADRRPVSRGLPSGAEPGRRLADLAVDAFVERLGLAVSFAHGGGRRYDDAEIREVLDRVRATLPA